MSVVRSELIREHSRPIRQLYGSRELLDPLEEIAGEKLHPYPKRDEEFLITKQHCRGDTIAGGKIRPRAPTDRPAWVVIVADRPSGR